MSSRLQRLASANLVPERKAKLLSLSAIRNIIQTYSLGKSCAAGSLRSVLYPTFGQSCQNGFLKVIKFPQTYFVVQKGHFW